MMVLLLEEVEDYYFITCLNNAVHFYKNLIKPKCQTTTMVNTNVTGEIVTKMLILLEDKERTY